MFVYELAEYVRSIAAFMVLVSLCGIFVTDRFKGIFGFTAGIVLILTVLKPVSGFVNGNISFNGFKGESIDYTENTADTVIKTFEKNCEELIGSTLGAEASVYAADEGEGVLIRRIVLRTDGNNAELKKRAAELCGISEDKVLVINKGGGEYNEADR